MLKNLFLHGMGIRKGRLRGLMWAGVLLCYSLLISPLYAGAETCTTGIDYNKPTIAAGAHHTVALKEDGTVVAMNYQGQLNVSDWTNIKAIAAGTFHTVGLKEDGTVVATGWNGYGQLNVSDWTNIKAIAAGGGHTAGLKEDGTVVALGWNEYGQLNVSNWSGIKAISTGNGHTVGLKEDGTVVAVGVNNHGQLNVWGWSGITSVSAGGGHTVGLKEDGTVVAVGMNWWGQLNVSDWTNIKAIAAGNIHTVGLKEDGTVVAVGNGWRGQLNVSDWTNITAIAAAENFTIGLKEDGAVVATEYIGLDGSAYLYEFLKFLDWTNIRQPACADDTPPIVNLYVSSNILWPPDRKMVDVWIGGDATDALSGLASVVITVTDEYGTVEPIVNGFNTTIPLEAWRKGTDKDGRIYTISVIATDIAGNKSTATVEVLVPHDQGN
ncbi:MAG: hypothetical protein Q7T53_12970 [Deltaproteobacteria bacterium]|nr:hypothetical protein [Deltaproteobacteria bacterium]